MFCRHQLAGLAFLDHLAGVLVVCVLDPEAGILAVYPSEELPRRYTADEELTLPEVFPDFRARVRQFLE